MRPIVFIALGVFVCKPRPLLLALLLSLLLLLLACCGGGLETVERRPSRARVFGTILIEFSVFSVCLG